MLLSSYSETQIQGVLIKIRKARDLFKSDIDQDEYSKHVIVIYLIMSDAVVSAFRKCGFSLSEESVLIKLQVLSESLQADTVWLANHYEVFLSSR